MLITMNKSSKENQNIKFKKVKKNSNQGMTHLHHALMIFGIQATKRFNAFIINLFNHINTNYMFSIHTRFFKISIMCKNCELRIHIFIFSIATTHDYSHATFLLIVKTHIFCFANFKRIFKHPGKRKHCWKIMLKFLIY